MQIIQRIQQVAKIANNKCIPKLRTIKTQNLINTDKLRIIKKER